MFPAIRRDVAMLVPESTAHEAIVTAVKQVRPPHLEKFELFDVFRGRNIPLARKAWPMRSPIAIPSEP